MPTLRKAQQKYSPLPALSLGQAIGEPATYLEIQIILSILSHTTMRRPEPLNSKYTLSHTPVRCAWNVTALSARC